MDAANAQARARVARSAHKSAAAQQERSSMSVDLPCRCHERPCEWYPLSACPCVSCFVVVAGFTLVCLFERSKFLIATSQKKKMCVCGRLILVLVGSLKRYCCRTLRQYDTMYVYRAASPPKKKQNAQHTHRERYTRTARHTRTATCV